MTVYRISPSLFKGEERHSRPSGLTAIEQQQKDAGGFGQLLTGPEARLMLRLEVTRWTDLSASEKTTAKRLKERGLADLNGKKDKASLKDPRGVEWQRRAKEVGL